MNCPYCGREMKEGYIPTDNDRKQNVNFDSFVRTLLAESESDIYIYSRYEDGKTYKITKDESFPSFRIGRKILINKAEFLLWLDGRSFVKEKRR